MIKWYRKPDNTYGGRYFDGDDAPDGYIETPMPPHDLRDMWTGAEWDLPISYLRGDVCDLIAAAREVRISQGVFWKFNNAAPPMPIKIDNGMREFLNYTHTLIKASVANPHNGEIWQDGTRFSINDVGLVELAEFTAAWGFQIYQVARAQMDLVDEMTGNDLDDYDAEAIDWTVEWPRADWINDTVTQNP